MIITIDGPAGSGKSTVAKKLAEKLGFIHFNSGSLYRAITAYLHSINFEIEKISKDSTFPPMDLKVEMIDNIQHVYVNEVDYTSKLRQNQISTLAPFVAANKHLRNVVDICQRKFCSTHNVVMEGRDLGSFVFPNADYKFYLDCSLNERARRRYLEEKAKNNNVSLKEITEQLAERDKLDKTREVAPLIIPKGAIIIDSTNKNADQVVNCMFDTIKNNI